MNRSEIQKARLEEAEFQKAYEELFGETFEKAVYKDTAENRKLGRVGKEYARGRKKGNAAPEDKSRKTGNGGKSKVDTAKIDKEASTFIDDFLYDQGANKNKLTADEKKSLDNIKSIASDFYKQNPDLVGDKDFRMEMVGGDVDELKEKYGDRKGFKKFNDALEEWYG